MVYVSRWKLISFFLLVCFSTLLVLPNFVAKDQWPSWLFYRPISLGLDLRGGVDLSLEADFNSFFSDQYTQIANNLRKQIREKKWSYTRITATAGDVHFILPTDVSPTQVSEVLSQIDPALVVAFSSDTKGLVKQKQEQTKATVSFHQKAVVTLKKKTLERSIEVIRRRIDAQGTLDPYIHTQGDNRIIIQVPGFHDPQMVKNLLGKTAKLTFQWVWNKESEGQKVTLKDKETRDYPLENEALLTGEDVTGAKAGYHTNAQTGAQEAGVFLEFGSKGARYFSDLTRKGAASFEKGDPRYIAIVLDQTVLSAPLIKHQINDGHAVITGETSIEKAQELAALVRSGSLPAPLNILEEKVVGPGLGEDSIRYGTWATLWAVLGVCVFMILSYSFFGLLSVIGVVFNLLFLMAALSALGATLTLPGIAGIALTIGMAVDANVLINERIKEELRLGRKVITAVHSGYRRAINSIVDSNLTTLIGTALLYGFGAGPVRGLAITMAFGIVISMFTALSLTHNLANFWLQKYPRKTLPL
jgi:preprotein translocase subunit SecD